MEKRRFRARPNALFQFGIDRILLTGNVLTNAVLGPVHQTMLAVIPVTWFMLWLATAEPAIRLTTAGGLWPYIG